MRIAVVGAGAIARRGHLPGLMQSRCRVSALVETDPERRAEVAKEFDISRTYADVGSLLSSEDVEAVAVCTPTDTHFAILSACMDAGKHTIVEKPLAYTFIQARELAARSRMSKQTHAVVQNWRYFPAVVAARQRLAAHKLGAVHLGHAVSAARFPNGWTRSKWLFHKRGLLYDFAPHAVDLVMYLLDAKPQVVQAWTKDWTEGMGTANACKIVVEYEGGVLFSFDLSWLTGSVLFHVILHGTAGHVSLDVRNNLMWEMHGSVTPIDVFEQYLRSAAVLTRDVATGRYVAGPMEYYSQIYDNFFDAVQEKELPLVSFEDALQTNLVLDAAFISASTGQRVPINDVANGQRDAEFERLLADNRRQDEGRT